MATAPSQDDRGILPGALLVGAVLLILGAGVVLSTDRPQASRPARAPAPAAPAPTTPPPEEAPVSPGVQDLESRAADDLRRLGVAGGRYTAQLVVACKAETVERLLSASQGARDLYVLPAQVKGAPCWRVCWGSYATAEEAGSMSDLPSALRGAEKPRPVEIVAVLP
jgi:septal ring-binding cell division protein DamX